MSLGNVVVFVTRLLDDHGHSGSELPAMSAHRQVRVPLFSRISASGRPHIQTSARVRGRGALPSMSVKPYSTATLAATSTVPVYRMTSGSAASAATARPMNSGDSEFVRSSQGAASMTFSVLTNPGYKDTAVTPYGRNSTAISAVILSVAAFDTP